MNDRLDVRAIDPHAERGGRADHAERADECSCTPCVGRPACRYGTRRPAHRRRAARRRPSPPRRGCCFSVSVDTGRILGDPGAIAIEARHDDVRRAEAEELDDVVAHFRAWPWRSGRRTGDVAAARRLGAHRGGSPQARAIGPEVVSSDTQWASSTTKRAPAATPAGARKSAGRNRSGATLSSCSAQARAAPTAARRASARELRV
jgi:hypothetical protein